MPLNSEDKAKLQPYADLLVKWQKTINLVSKNTLEDLWARHFEDSAQLSQYITKNANVMDLGSGGGFPGMVLALLRPDIDMTLIESDTRKCAFLQNVSRETSINNVTVLNERIENVSRETSVDYITARALASVEKLLEFSEPFIKQSPELICLFLKGEKANLELEEASNTYVFDIEKIDSQTSDVAKILKITNVSRET